MAIHNVRPARMSAAERREQILDATQEIVGEQGFHALSIEAVARRAGISRPVVYEHFGDISGLFEALIERLGDRAIRQLAAVLPTALDAGNPREQLLGALGGYLEAAQADPVTWRLVLMPPEGAPETVRDRIAIGRSAVLSQLAEAVRPGLAGGGQTPDPELTARMLSTFADEAVRLLLLEPDEYPIDRLLKHARWLLGQIEPFGGLPPKRGRG
ncbi:MAG: TetR/AcrR family transcriptional regulator [Candidatus Dormiibacterota bacterium]